MGLFYEIFIEPFTWGEWTGYIVGVIIWVATLLLVVVVAGLIHDVIDTASLPTRKVRGWVKGKTYTPAHTTYVNTGKTIVPVHHPERWSAEIAIPGGDESIGISRALYEGINKQDGLDVLVVTGRLSKSPKIVGLAEE